MKKLLLFTLLIYIPFFTTVAQVGFQSHTIIDQGSTNAPTDAFAADVDGDGNLDLVSTSQYDNKVAWYKNDGAGNLGSQQIISINELDLISGEGVDFNADGNVDILCASGTKIVWFPNNGGGSFGTPRQIASNNNGHVKVLAKDIDADGDADLVVMSNIDSKLSWYENVDGLGNFGPEHIVGTDIYASGGRILEASDIDNDGDLDLISKKEVWELVWFENIDGQGTFGSEQLISENISSIYLLVYGFDIDADSDNDILTIKDNKIIYYENLNGQGNFSVEHTLIADNVNHFLLKDFDQDGDIDFVGNLGNKIIWYENLNGQGNFANQQELVTGSTIMDLADVNENGSLDLITINTGKDKVAWFASESQGVFGDEINLSIIKAAQGVYDAHAADIDGDGNIDVISANSDAQSITWFKNTDGQGNFGPAAIVSENLIYVQSILPADLDGDGDIDIISSSNENYELHWYKNVDGLGTFEAQPPLLGSGEGSSFVYADDLDGDGDMDILSASISSMLWFENLDGLGNFEQAQIIEDDLSYCESIYTADFDGDADKDIVVADYFGNYFAWYENLDGQANFSPRITLEEDVEGSFFLYPADLDGDGDIDLVGSVIHEDLLIWYENTDGNATFSSRQILAENVPTAERIKTFDPDQDGDEDILISDFVEKTFSWFENTDGQGTLGPRQILDYNIKGALPIATADFDNNGTIDILAGSLRSDSIKWFENLGRLGNSIDGTVTLDLDSNGCTSNDAPMTQIMVVADNGAHSFATFTQPNGAYQLYTNEGTFTTTLNSELPNYYSPNPPFHTSTFVGQNNSDTGDFCVEPTATINDLNITLYPLGDARPGFEAEYQIVFNNVGTTVLNGTVTLSFDEMSLELLNASEPISSQTNSMVTFDYTNFKPFETKSIDVNFQVAAPPTTQIGDLLVFDVTIDPIPGDITEADNTFIFEQTVIGSLDPNDIQVLEGESIFMDEADDYLHYIIRFQNTGTASAINVSVSNELDQNLDWTTMQIETISHSNRVEITDGNQVEFIFNNINLPDSTSNEPASHGYIQYKIKPKSTIAVGNFIKNDAAIYFDFNPPVITNTVITTVIEPLGVEENATNSVTLYPVPASDILNINSTLPIIDAKVFNNLGQLLFTIENLKGIEQLNIALLSTGIYFVKLTDLEQNTYSNKFIKQE